MVGLQGTPVQNTLTELFALLHFLDPSEFPDPEQSAQEFAQVDAQGGVVFKDKGGMEQQVSRIHELLQPRMLRRLKREVMRDMIPGKKLVEVRCALTLLQHHLYGAILKKNYKQLNHGNRTGKKRSLNTILMDLKMVCNHPVSTLL
jgi:chromodomain-helicase-DNA-binding protein 4